MIHRLPSDDLSFWGNHLWNVAARTPWEAAHFNLAAISDAQNLWGGLQYTWVYYMSTSRYLLRGEHRHKQQKPPAVLNVTGSMDGPP